MSVQMPEPLPSIGCGVTGAIDPATVAATSHDLDESRCHHIGTSDGNVPRTSRCPIVSGQCDRSITSRSHFGVSSPPLCRGIVSRLVQFQFNPATRDFLPASCTAAATATLPLSARGLACGNASRAAVVEAARASGLGSCIHSTPACLGCYAAVFYLSLQQHQQKVCNDAVATARKARYELSNQQRQPAIPAATPQVDDFSASDKHYSAPQCRKHPGSDTSADCSLSCSPPVSGTGLQLRNVYVTQSDCDNCNRVYSYSPIGTTAGRVPAPKLRSRADSRLNVDSAAVAVAAAAGCCGHTDSRKALLSVTRSVLEIDEDEDEAVSGQCCWLVNGTLTNLAGDAATGAQAAGGRSRQNKDQPELNGPGTAGENYTEAFLSGSDSLVPITSPDSNRLSPTKGTMRFIADDDFDVRYAVRRSASAPLITSDPAFTNPTTAAGASTIFYPSCTIADPFAVVNGLTSGLSVADALGAADTLEDEGEDIEGPVAAAVETDDAVRTVKSPPSTALLPGSGKSIQYGKSTKRPPLESIVDCEEEEASSLSSLSSLSSFPSESNASLLPSIDGYLPQVHESTPTTSSVTGQSCEPKRGKMEIRPPGWKSFGSTTDSATRNSSAYSPGGGVRGSADPLSCRDRESPSSTPQQAVVNWQHIPVGTVTNLTKPIPHVLPAVPPAHLKCRPRCPVPTGTKMRSVIEEPGSQTPSTETGASVSRSSSERCLNRLRRCAGAYSDLTRLLCPSKVVGPDGAVGARVCLRPAVQGMDNCVSGSYKPASTSRPSVLARS